MSQLETAQKVVDDLSDEMRTLKEQLGRHRRLGEPYDEIVRALYGARQLLTDARRELKFQRRIANAI